MGNAFASDSTPAPRCSIAKRLYSLLVVTGVAGAGRGLEDGAGVGALLLRTSSAAPVVVLPSTKPRLISGTRLPWSDLHPAEGPMALRHRLSSILPFREALVGVEFTKEQGPFYWTGLP